MSDFPASRTRSVYLTDELLLKIEEERDRIAQGNPRRRPTFSKAVVALVERALAGC